MDEYLLKLDNIIRQTTSLSPANDMFLNEMAAETMKEISESLKVINHYHKKKKIYSLFILGQN